MRELSMSDLPVEGQMSMDVLEIANRLEYELTGFLKVEPVGVYLINKLEPVIVQDRPCYYLDETGNEKIVTDISKVTSNVFDSNHKTIIPKVFIADKDKYLSNKSFLPYRGIKIVELLLKESLYSNINYLNRHDDSINKIRQHLIEDIDEVQLVELLNIAYACTSGVRHDLEKFIGKDTWHMYSISLKNKIVDVVKFIDHRIYEWTIQNNKQQEHD